MSGICDHADLVCVDWNPDPYSLQFWFTEIAIYFGFTELVQSGAKAINMSFGISASVKYNRASYYDRVLKPKALSLTMASLLDKGYDFLVVQSAGNGNSFSEPVDSTNNGHFTAITDKTVYTGKYNIPKEDIDYLYLRTIGPNPDCITGAVDCEYNYLMVEYNKYVEALEDSAYYLGIDGQYEYLKDLNGLFGYEKYKITNNKELAVRNCVERLDKLADRIELRDKASDNIKKFE